MSSTIKLILLTLSLTFAYSCGDDACEVVICLNDGVCNDGTCDCILGFEGDTCGVEARTKFFGSYIFESETCGNFEPSFELIPIDDSLTELTLLVTTNNGDILNLTVNLISANTYTTSSGAIVSEFIDDTIIVTFENCSATYLRQ